MIRILVGWTDLGRARETSARSSLTDVERGLVFGPVKISTFGNFDSFVFTVERMLVQASVDKDLLLLKREVKSAVKRGITGGSGFASDVGFEL